jgi:proteasome lid subunit RPN8/RPN11
VLEIAADVFDEMIAHARREAPVECCGLLAGKGGTATVCYPLLNELASPVAYRAEVHSLFDAFRDLRRRELELLAIYHSHPTSPAQPSRVDLAENHYGDVPRIIISLAAGPPVVKMFRLLADRFEELPYCRAAN